MTLRDSVCQSLYFNHFVYIDGAMQRALRHVNLSVSRSVADFVPQSIGFSVYNNIDNLIKSYDT